MRTWIVALLVVVVAFAGCADSGKDQTEAGTDGADGGAGTGNTGGNTDPGTGGNTGSTGGSPNGTAIVPVLEVSTLNGTAPLTVDFTLSALNATGAMNWTLVDGFGGNTTEIANGTMLPANATYLFEVEGDHSITFTIGANASATQTIAVGAAAPSGPTDLVVASKVAGGFTPDETDAHKLHSFEVEAGALAITIMGDWNGGLPLSDNWGYPNDIDIYLRSPAGTEAAKSEMLGFEFLHHEGDLAAGTWTLDLLAYDIVEDAAYEFDIIVWYKQPTLATQTGEAVGDVDVMGDSPYSHTFEVPSHAQAVVTYLSWTSPANANACNSATVRTHDLDLSVKFGGSEVFGSGYFHSCEFNFIESGPAGASLNKGGTWTVDVVPFMSPSASYTVQFWYA